MARDIKLSRLNLENVNYQYVGAYRLRIEVADVAGGMTPHIFLYRRDPYNPVTEEQLDSFMALAGPADIADYPPLDPDPNQPFPFFRLDYMEVDVRATLLAEEVWDTVKREACILCQALDRLEQLVIVEETWCSGQSEDPGGESESGSVSLSESV